MLWIIQYLIIFLFGTIIGSFVNVVVYRLPRGENIVSSRSKCSHCQRPIAWYDLIPLVSFFISGRCCRQCHQPISWQYPLVELASAILFVSAYLVFSNSGWAHLLSVVILLEVFLALAVIDYRYLVLPDKIILFGLVVVLILERPAAANFWAAAGLFLFFFLIWLLSRGRWLGLGDAKLAFLVGLVFGPVMAICAVYTAIIAGALTALGLLIFRKASLKTKLPLGAFISLSAILYFFVGNDIINRLGGFYRIFLIFK